VSLADQIVAMEEELQRALEDARMYERTCNILEDQNEDLSDELIDACDFIDFVDKTNPELRVAYNAAKALEGNKNG
jgi:hypothetical protein